MTWPASNVTIANTDAVGDNPQAARADILDLMQKFNLLREHFSVFMHDFAELQNAGAARNALGAVGTTGDQTVDGYKTMPRGVRLNSELAWMGFWPGGGAGATVAQLTSNTTSVSIQKPTGLIDVFSQSLAAGASINFQVSNSLVTARSVVLVSQVNTSFEVRVIAVQSGLFVVRVTNISGAAAPTALQVNFLVMHATNT